MVGPVKAPDEETARTSPNTGPPAPAAYAASDLTGPKGQALVSRGDGTKKAEVTNESEGRFGGPESLCATYGPAPNRMAVNLQRR